MEPIELKIDQFKKDKNLLIPMLKDHNTLYFHPLTKDYDSLNYRPWGYSITSICKKNNIQYYFFKTGDRKVNIYPNSIIEEWYFKNEQKIISAKKKLSPLSLSEEQRNTVLELIKKDK